MSSEFCQLADVAEVIDSLHKTPSYVVAGYPMVRVTDVKYGQLDLTKTFRVNQETYLEFSRRYKPSSGDIIVTRVGSYGIFGKVFDKDFCLGQNTAAIVPKDISSDYLYAVLNSSCVQSQIEALVVGSTQKTLSLKAIKELKIPRLGSQTEQMISEIAACIDLRIQLLSETNATLEAIAQALFKSWFVDFDPVRAKMEGRAPEGMDEATAALFPDSFEESELGLVPKGWRVGTLADVASYQNGYAFKTKDWSGVGHPVIKIGNVKPGIIETTGASYVLPETIVGLDRFRLQRGDLLVGMTGYVGETGLVPEIEPAAYLNQRVGKISTENGISDLGFVYCIVRNPAYKTHAESKSHGSAQANVSGTDLMSYPTVLPSAVVLDVFNQILAVFIWQILVKYEESQTLAALRDTLLPRLISGQLRLTPSS